MTLKLKHLCLKFLSNFTLSTERATQQFEGLCCTTTTLEQSSFQIVNIYVTTIDSSNNAAAKSNTLKDAKFAKVHTQNILPNSFVWAEIFKFWVNKNFLTSSMSDLN